MCFSTAGYIMGKPLLNIYYIFFKNHSHFETAITPPNIQHLIIL